ncbi:unnamed protein product [Somion occarium]|uniref:Histone deacetylase domain-containing protein n=1 Tax=Somion occarium TaxID=3059160 RepID=A0ABP1DWZ8_9APHY
MSLSTDTTEISVFIQEDCLRHRFIRSKDVSNIVERPERLRAVNIGISAAISRLESVSSGFDSSNEPVIPTESKSDIDLTDDLTAALDKLKLASSSYPTPLPLNLVKSSAKVELLNNPAVKFVHGDIDGDMYLENLIKWSKESRDRIAQDGTEIPSPLSQGDLYLCPESIDAIQGALGASCEAVDAVLGGVGSNSLTSRSKRAFAAVRPPGHHCGEDTPSGFCFVNNVAVAAAHAHLKHGINRVVILDIDLHHGNGTQSIVWQINEESYRNTIEASNGSQAAKIGPQIFYGSLHDVLSYPCEDGKAELVQAASVSIHGPHGQYIENIHLQTYQSEEEFWERLYNQRYSKLLKKAESFIEETGGPSSDVLVFVSAGFDASEHEHQSMQRHQRRVPTSFYYRFTRDACKFADRVAQGRIISVLEGGYSDRALISGVMAHLIGLASEKEDAIDEEWWNTQNLAALESTTKKRRGGRPSHTKLPAPWLQRTLEVLATIDSSPPPTKPVIPPSSMSLRGRQKRASSGNDSTGSIVKDLASKSLKAESKSNNEDLQKASITEIIGDTSDSLLSDVSEKSNGQVQGKKLPRVILKLSPKPESES